MKRIALALVVATLAAAVCAQAQGPIFGPGPREGRAVETTVTGVLAFIDDRPAIKTDSGIVLLAMPEFYKYAYIDGIKAGQAVKASGALVAPPSAPAPKGPADKAVKADPKAQPEAKVGDSILVAKEVTIGARTYVIVGRGPELGGPGQGLDGRRGPSSGAQDDSQPRPTDGDKDGNP